MSISPVLRAIFRSTIVIPRRRKYSAATASPNAPTSLRLLCEISTAFIDTAHFIVILSIPSCQGQSFIPTIPLLFPTCPIRVPIQAMSVRAGRIGLPSRPWQGRVLPLNHARFGAHPTISFGAPTRTRTWNDSSEDCCDIHFTIGAMKQIVRHMLVFRYAFFGPYRGC